eukprot:1160213-Pelagomonas_calceolata.AAC.8
MHRQAGQTGLSIVNCDMSCCRSSTAAAVAVPSAQLFSTDTTCDAQASRPDRLEHLYCDMSCC